MRAKVQSIQQNVQNIFICGGICDVSFFLAVKSEDEATQSYKRREILHLALVSWWEGGAFRNTSKEIISKENEIKLEIDRLTRVKICI